MQHRINALYLKIVVNSLTYSDARGVCATYYVIVEQAVFGMGEEKGNALGEAAKRKTFGSTIHKLVKAGLLSGAIELRFKSLLKERNWLVHSSKASSRNAIHHESAMQPLVNRVDSISTESNLLIKVVGELIEEYVKSHGVSEEYISSQATEILKQWHSE